MRKFRGIKFWILMHPNEPEYTIFLNFASEFKLNEYTKQKHLHIITNNFLFFWIWKTKLLQAAEIQL